MIALEKSLDVDVLLLSAGFGKRLRPLTEHTPKPLISFCGKTILERNLEMIARSGVTEMWINLHYLGEQIEQFVGDGSKWGIRVRYSRENPILDTGGAIKNIEAGLHHERLVLVNSDIVLSPEFNLRDIVCAHAANQRKPWITMLLGPQGSPAEYGAIGINEQGEICRFLDLERSKEESIHTYIYLGIMVIERRVLDSMPPRGEVFSITRDIIRDLFIKQMPLAAWVYQGFWSDLGTPERLDAASKQWERTFSVS